MQLQTNFRIAATSPSAEPQAVRGRDPREPRPIEAGQAAGDARSRTAGEQAAIVNFGALAVGRAREREQPPAAPETRAGETSDGQELANHQQRVLDDLQQRDREVHGHEQAQRSVGGQYTSSSQLDYQIGPNGERYAVASSSSIDVTPVPNDPEATVHKMETIERAATAPSNPSGADRQVAAEASQQARRARQARAKLAAARYASARALAPDRGDGTASAPTGPRSATGPRNSKGPAWDAAEPASPAPRGRRPGAPGETRGAAPGRLLAIQG